MMRDNKSCPLLCSHGARAAGRTWIQAKLRELLRKGDMTVTDAAYVALDSLDLL